MLNNRLSEFFMTGLNSVGVPTHFIRRLNMREQLIRAVEIIPLEVVVRNVAAGSISKRLGIEEGTPLPRPIVEFYFKKRRAGRSACQRGTYHRLRLGRAAGPRRHGQPRIAARERFPVGTDAGRRHPAGGFQDRDRADLGWRLHAPHRGRRDQPGFVSACGISRRGTRLDKDVFRRDLGNLADAYTEVARRLGVMPQRETGTTKPTLIN